ncbi:MAG: class I SAM-dependent methyltransferase [Acidimicrobiales bacterium]
MGFYGDRIFPLVMNALMDNKEARRIRAEVCAPLRGDVLEIGFGTGHNLPFLPVTVRSLKAVDPLLKGRELAAARLAASTVAVEFVGLDGQRLALDDQSVDAALSTWTLCSIPDPAAAVREIARVLRPGGKLHFVEHGRARDPKVERWQRRLNGVQQRMACGCSLTYDMAAVVGDGGMDIEQLDTFYAKGEPKSHGWTYQGVATPSPR